MGFLSSAFAAAMPQTAVRQRDVATRRRRYACDKATLLTWEDDEGIHRFELCVKERMSEHVMSWDADKGMLHTFMSGGNALRATPQQVRNRATLAEQALEALERANAGPDLWVHFFILSACEKRSVI